MDKEEIKKIADEVVNSFSLSCGLPKSFVDGSSHTGDGGEFFKLFVGEWKEADAQISDILSGN